MFSFQNATKPSNEHLRMALEYKKYLNQDFYALVQAARAHREVGRLSSGPNPGRQRRSCRGGRGIPREAPDEGGDVTGDARRQTKKPMLPLEPGVSADSRPCEQMPRMPPLHSGLTGASRGSAVSGCSAITEEKRKGALAGAGIVVLVCCYHTVLWVRKQKLRGGGSLEMSPPSHVRSTEPRSTQC